MDVARLFLTLAAILIAAKVLGELAERMGQPAVLGELVAGALLGGSALGVVPTTGVGADVVHLMAQLGVVLLLFEIGLETDLKAMFRVGPAALTVAVVGVTVPFGLGYAYWARSDPGPAAIFVGATLTATSVGITARVLADLRALGSPEARVIIGAAVIDDILGLVILSVVSALAMGGAVTITGTIRTLAVAVGFLVAAVLIGRYAMPALLDIVVRMRVRSVVLVVAVAFALGLSALAEQAGSALILGAFAAGLILSGTNQFDTIAREVRSVASVFTPIFFVSVGASLDWRLLDPSSAAARATLVLALALSVIGIVGKMAAGWAAPWEPMRRLVVGVGMVPRGEVGLIFADVGRRSGILSDEVFGAVLLMIMVTTFVAPPALKALLRSPSEARA